MIAVKPNDVRVSVAETCEVLHISQQVMRKMLRQKTVPYGTATIVGHARDGTPRWRYDVWKQKVMEETGLKEWPVKGGEEA